MSDIGFRIRAFDRSIYLPRGEMPTAHIYIVRHGETAENRAMIVQGQRDTALNELGRAQARLVGRLPLRDIPFDVAWSSDLQRAAKVCLKGLQKSFIVCFNVSL
jgi:bisphosphoglycerate-dependent phosphoglycerate mutase